MVLSTSQRSSYPVLSTGSTRCASQPPQGGGASTRGHTPSRSPPWSASHDGPAPIGTPQYASHNCQPGQAPEFVHLVMRDNPARPSRRRAQCPAPAARARAIGCMNLLVLCQWTHAQVMPCKSVTVYNCATRKTELSQVQARLPRPVVRRQNVIEAARDHSAAATGGWPVSSRSVGCPGGSAPAWPSGVA